MKRKSRTNDQVPFRSMKVDRSYQRDIGAGKVRAIASDFSEKGLGALHVSARPDGYYLVDGQHRWKAAMELGHGEMKALCVVYRGLTVAEEAELFLLLNDSKNTSALDRYKAGLIAENPICVGIRDTLADYGLHIGAGDADGTIRCISKVEALYKRDPEALDALCTILTEAWGARVSAFEQVVVDGVGKVVSRYNGELNRGALIKKLSGYKGGPTALAGDARGYADYRPITVGRACAEIVVDTYNKGRRSGALPPL